MKRALLLFLVACGSKEAPPAPDAGVAPPPVSVTPVKHSAPPPPATLITPSDKPDAPPVPYRSKEGQACGGVTDLQCEKGLKCIKGGPTVTDQSGTCQKIN